MDKLIKPEQKTNLSASYADSAAIKKSGKLFFRNRELIDFSCPDCLGLAQSKGVKRAAQESLENSGYGSVSSRKNSGTRSEHLFAEKALAAFFGYPQALLFSSKNQAFFSLFASLLSEQDQVICDEDLAGLMTDICLLLSCNLETVNLEKVSNLDSLLQQPFYGRKRFVIADTVSQTSARKVDLATLTASCARYSAFLIVDESNAVGMLGNRGAGLFEEFSASSPAQLRPFALISELGSGLGCFGSMVCSEVEAIDSIISTSKTMLMEPALPACFAAAISAACNQSELMFLERTLVLSKLASLHQELLKIKPRLNMAISSFISIRLPKISIALELQNYLFAKGFWVDVLPCPFKFSQDGYIRIFPSIYHSDLVYQQLSDALDSFFAK